MEDIKLSIEDINEFISPDSDYSLFQNDKKTQAAVERRIEIIGEAMDRVLKVDPQISITDSRKIVDTRNRIIHNYENILPEVIWLIIKENLPLLYEEVTEILTKTK